MQHIKGDLLLFQSNEFVAKSYSMKKNKSTLASWRLVIAIVILAQAITCKPLCPKGQKNSGLNPTELRFKSLLDSIDLYNRQGDHQHAFSLAEQLYSFSLDSFGVNTEQYAQVCQALGIGFYKAGQRDTAIFLLKKTAGIRAELSGKPFTELATTYSNLAAFYVDSYELDSAKAYIGKSLGILDKHFPIGHPSFAPVLNTLGIVNELEGNYLQALDIYGQVLKIKLGNPKFTPIQISNTYNNIGAVYQGMDDIGAAIQHFQKSLDLLIQHKFQHTYEYTIGLMNLGVAYFYANDMGLAEKHLKLAMQHAETSLPENHPQWGMLYINLGNVIQVQGNMPDSEKFFNKALEVFTSNFGLVNYYNSACHIGLGAGKVLSGNLDSALAHFKLGQQNAEASLGESHSEVINILNNIGATYDKMGQYEEALRMFEDGVGRYEGKYRNVTHGLIPTLPYMDAQFNVANMVGRQYVQNRDSDRLDRLKNEVNKSLGIFYGMKSNFNKDLSGNILLEKCRPLYEVAIKAMLENGDNEKAFSLLEESKAAILFASIKKSEAKRFKGVPQNLLEKLLLTENEIYLAEKKLTGLVDDFLFAELNALSLAIDSLKNEQDRLEAEIIEACPDYEKIRFDLSTVPLAKTQTQLLGTGQTLLEYFVGDSSIFIFTIRPDHYDVVEVKKDFPLDSLVQQLQNGLYGYYGKKEDERTDDVYRQSLKDYVEAAPKLYGKLIAPVKDQLTGEVVLVPDGVLGYVPFGALLKGQPKSVSDFSSYPFLLNDHQFSYCYSATLLREMKEKQHKTPPTKPLVAFAPFYEESYAKAESHISIEFDTLADGRDTIIINDVVTRKEFNNLPSSGEEVAAASKLWNGDYFLNQDATEDRFNEVAGDYRIIHLSTHGKADPRVGDYSYLAFAEQKDSIENEYLYVRDLYNLQLNADLVILSACETATGELQRGEGIISLARAFAYAGAKSILTTLWVVDDAATKDLTKEFYVELKKGKTKDRALHLAKRSHLKKNKNSRKHPFFWAAMIAVGDMSAIQ